MTERSSLSHTEKRNRGFTLIELLVALALGVVLIGALYGTFFSVVRAGEGKSGEIEKLIQAGRFLDSFTGEIHSAFFRPSSPETIFTGTIDGPNSSITFTTLTHPHMKKDRSESDLMGVGYFTGKGEKGFLLYRESFNPYTGDGYKVEVIEGIGGFEVSFFNGKSWSRAWDAGIDGRLPEAVRVRLRLDSGMEFSALARTMIR